MNEALDRIAENYVEGEENLISILQNLQDEFGYLPEDAIAYLSEKLDVHGSKFFGIATFYAQFYLSPRGKNIITSCCGTACHVKGSHELYNLLRNEFNLSEDEQTSKDGLCSVEKVACVGACSIAPVVIINKKVNGKVTKGKLKKEIKLMKEEGTVEETG